MRCYCGSENDFSECCQALIEGQKPALSAEALMRSRYSAYACGHFDYIVATYSKDTQAHLTVAEVEKAAADSEWLALRIEATSPATDSHPEQVRFCAYYRVHRQLHQLRETSNFVLEDGQWRYHDGHIHSDSGSLKWSRNAPCFCGSGHKYKRCHAL